MRGIFFGSLLVALLLLTIGTQTGTVSANNSHVEYVVEPQPGISVIQLGNSGIVNVTVTQCLMAGEKFAFTMLISSDREGSSTLSIRKQGNPDVSDWFSVSPKTIDLPSVGTKVTVKIEPPVGAELDRKAVTRIQEIGDGPTPGGHHGVKVAISCVEMPDVPLETTPTLPPEETPSPTPTTPTATSTIQPPEPTPTPQLPTQLPVSGGEPPTNDATRNTALAGTGIAALVLSAIAGHQALLRRR